jgi:transposase-like protein
MPRPATTNALPTVPAKLPAPPSARIVAVGKALYADRWQSALAEAIGVARSTLLRWVDNNSAPDDLDARLRAAVAARRREIKEHGVELGRLAEMLETRK